VLGVVARAKAREKKKKKKKRCIAHREICKLSIQTLYRLATAIATSNCWSKTTENL